MSFRDDLALTLFGFEPLEELPASSKANIDLRVINDPIFRGLISLVKPKIIAEIGSWKGSSAIYMANILKEANLDSVIVCIDTWLGSPEHWLTQDPSRNPGFFREWGYLNLNLKFGYPTLYFTFLNNIISTNCHSIIIPMPMTSDNAYVVLKRKRVTIDLAYIDAAHQFDPVLRDLEHYWELLNPEGGILFGDDYVPNTSTEVTLAANEFAKKVQRPIFGRHGKFVIPKGNYDFSPSFLEALKLSLIEV